MGWLYRTAFHWAFANLFPLNKEGAGEVPIGFNARLFAFIRGLFFFRLSFLRLSSLSPVFPVVHTLCFPLASLAAVPP